MQGAKRNCSGLLRLSDELCKKINNVEVFEFTKFPDMGEHLKEITHGGADVVIDCGGWMEKSPLEFLEQKLKLQGGTLGPIQIATKAVRKYGTVQMTGVYGGNYNAFPLGAFWVRNINLKWDKHLSFILCQNYLKITNKEFDPKEIITHKIPLKKRATVIKF